jgi:SnoaL-like domain
MVYGQLTDADLLELARLVTELAWRIDHRRSDTAADLFTGDGEMVLGPAAMHGRHEIEAWGRQRAAVDYTTRHVCTNLRFEACGDDAATGTTVVTVYRHTGDGPGDTRALTVGEYTDQFVRTSAGWLFRSRRIEQLFTAASS